MKRLDALSDMKQPRMSRTEQRDLMKLVRLRAKVRLGDVEKVAATWLAKIESQLAAEYKADHPAWQPSEQELC